MEKQLIPKLRFAKFEDNWKRKQLNDYIKLLSGYAFKGDEISENENGTALLRGINITEGKIRHSADIDRFYEKPINDLKKYLLKEGDLVLSMDGSKVGKNVALISKTDEGALLIQRVARLRSRNMADIRFIYLNIFSKRFHRYVDKVNTSSGIPHISSKQIKEFEMGFPSFKEQQKIAAFLTAVDTKITQLTKRQELLEQYKKAVMQKIFSQEIRFKDNARNEFPDWRKGRIDAFGSFYYGKSAPKFSVFKDAPTPCVRYGELYSTYKEIISEIKSYTNIDPKTLKFSKGGEVLVPRVGENPMDFANCSYLPLSGVAIGEMISVYNTKENGLFITYYFNAMLQRKFAKMVEGANVSNLYFKYLEDIQIQVPCLEEQIKIVEFLSSLDKKIKAVNTQIKKTISFKRGLLQQMFI